jgi:hypothetical protein
MNLLLTNCIYKINLITLSKITIKKTLDLPKIIKLSFFFYIDIKQYKKNILLFYIIVSLFFGNFLVLKKKEIRKIYILNIVLKKKNIHGFLINFVLVYLPLTSITKNIVKRGIILNVDSTTYRLSCLNFPTIAELDIFYMSCEKIYSYASSYKFQVDIYFYSKSYIKSLLDFLLRLYKFPCCFKTKKISK